MNVSELAKEIGVTEQDVLSLINMVVHSIKQDKMQDDVLSMDEEMRQMTVVAYISAEVKKFSEFCVSLLTNTEKKCAFDQYMLHKLQGV